MDSTNRTKSLFLAGLAASLLLIIFSMIMVVRVFDQYRQIFLHTQDNYLLHLAESVDRNISNLLDRYEEDLAHMTHHPDFTQGLELWQATGQSAPLLEELQGSILHDDELTVCVLVIQDGQTVLSSDEKIGYTFLDGSNTDTLRTCTGPDGDIYLAILHQETPELCFAALIDPDRFYDRLAGPAFSKDNWILLTDAQCHVLLYQQQQQAYVGLVDAVTGATSGQEGTQILLDSQRTQAVKATSYEYFDVSTGASYTARMAVVPSTGSENGCFAVGVVANYEADAAALNSAALRLMLFGSMLVAGILLLICLLVFTRHKDERELVLLRKKNEQLEAITRKTQELAHHQRLETIGTLTSSIAHEFNNLLTPIMGYSIMALEKIPPEEEEVYDSLLEIYQASQKAKNIISRLSDLSRKNTGLSYQYISPSELCRKVLEVAAPAQPAKVEVRLDTNTSGVHLYANETQLSQLLLNLVLNAFHAMESAGGILTLSTFYLGKEIFLQVSDTGTGIPHDILPHVFEPFFTTKEGGKGTGLGLAIVKQIAEEHNGSAKIDSQPDQGTTVTITLPLHIRPGPFLD